MTGSPDLSHVRCFACAGRGRRRRPRSPLPAGPSVGRAETVHRVQRAGPVVFSCQFVQVSPIEASDDGKRGRLV